MSNADPLPHVSRPQPQVNGSGVSLGFAVRTHHGTTVLSVSGELDAANSAYLADMLARFLRVRGGLVIDVSALTFCSVNDLEVFTHFPSPKPTRTLPMGPDPGAPGASTAQAIWRGFARNGITRRRSAPAQR